VTSHKPVIAISTGDPSGIGPEISIKALTHCEIYEVCRPFLIGDSSVFSELKLNGFKINRAESVRDMVFNYGTVDLLNMNVLDSVPPVGIVNRKSGYAAFQYIRKAIELALAGEIDATVNAPINKEALNLAGYKFRGYTEIYAHYTNAKDYAMVLVYEHFRVIHVSIHVSLREACDRVKQDRIIKVIKLADEICRQLGISIPKIGVAGLNPHAGENGLFGKEELEEIIPAIYEAKMKGIDVEGPISPDTIFSKLNAKLYDICVCMYHDQGHIPIKFLSFKWNDDKQKCDVVDGINITAGLQL